MTAQHDPLHDEGAELVERLRNAGVTTIHLDEPGLSGRMFKPGYVGMKFDGRQHLAALSRAA